MTDWVEVEIKAIDASGKTASQHVEYSTEKGEPAEAAQEIVRHIVAGAGAGRVKLVDADR